MPVLFKIALRIAGNEEAAEDLCHDALIKMTEKDMEFPSPNDAKYWLIRGVDSGEITLLKEDSILRVQAALEKLPQNLRLVLQLKEYGEMNYKEIGRVLGITEGNVKVRVFRAREQLSKLLGEEDVYLP